MGARHELSALLARLTSLRDRDGNAGAVEAGAYLVYPGFRDPDDHGVEFGAPEGSGVLALGEVGYAKGHPREGQGRPGVYKIGGYYDGEVLLELNYRIQLTRWLFFQPDVQGILRPRGRADIPDGFAIGFALGFSL